MNPTERILAVIEGKELDHVQTFCASVENWTAQQVLGIPRISQTTLMTNPLARFVFDRWGKKLKKSVTDPLLNQDFLRRIEASVELGFDSTWGAYDPTVILWDSQTIARSTGSFYKLIEDGHGNLDYMYQGPAIPTPEAFDAWPHFPDADEVAHNVYQFFKKAYSEFGDDICILAQSNTGIQESTIWALGFTNYVNCLRTKPEFIRRFTKMHEALIMKTNMAMMDAGAKIIIDCDDLAAKTGPMLNPKQTDTLYGDSYKRITKAVHDRGGKVLLHSCGDNTKLFDYMIEWGFDGGHTFENTSNVDIKLEKKLHGDQFTILGGVGVDYLLTKQSKPQEVVEAVEDLVKSCGPGGRFLIGPVHSHTDICLEKIRIMLDTVKRL
jgi:uroporphyrinogen-III decarboxylase